MANTWHWKPVKPVPRVRVFGGSRSANPHLHPWLPVTVTRDIPYSFKAQLILCWFHSSSIPAHTTQFNSFTQEWLFPVLVFDTATSKSWASQLQIVSRLSSAFICVSVLYYDSLDLYIRKFGKVRFSNMMFMNPSQHYNTQIIVYNHVSVTYKDYSNVIN